VGGGPRGKLHRKALTGGKGKCRVITAGYVGRLRLNHNMIQNGGEAVPGGGALNGLRCNRNGKNPFFPGEKTVYAEPKNHTAESLSVWNR